MVGAGKFGTMFLAQVRKLAGVQVVGIADLSVERARSNLEFIGWPSASPARSRPRTRRVQAAFS